jgi:sugar/nucleoside kinase (ribokinase family)
MAPGEPTRGEAGRPGGQSPGLGAAVRTALVKAPAVETLDPTGCGDVFGAVAFARLLAGDRVETALGRAAELAARNAGFRGASGLSRHLRGELVTL